MVSLTDKQDVYYFKSINISLQMHSGDQRGSGLHIHLPSSPLRSAVQTPGTMWESL